ncbi:MAG: hypothetical protein ACKODH_00080 [Limisphaerales bacterium]
MDAMVDAGDMRAGDLVSYVGEQNWYPLSQFLERHYERASAAAAEANKPSGEGGARKEATFVATPSGTSFLRRDAMEVDESGLTEAEREVMAGGRFITYRYCWSLVVSFKHASPPILVRAGKDGFGAALRYSLVSALFGWWGIPGPIWAISTIHHNAQGGKDVTLETLTQLVGHSRAAAACARHQASAQPGALMSSLGLMMAALSLALMLGTGWLGWAFAHGDLGEPAPGPGSKEFALADESLTKAKRSAIFGNVSNPKSLELADAFNKAMREAYLAEARQNPTADMEKDNPLIATFCELHQDRVVFLVQVAGLQKLDLSLRNKLADDAWRAAALILTDLKVGFTGLRVALGLRNSVKYDQVLTGRYVRDFEVNNTGLKSRAEGARSKAKLYPLFIPLEQLDSWKDE